MQPTASETKQLSFIPQASHTCRVIRLTQTPPGVDFVDDRSRFEFGLTNGHAPVVGRELLGRGYSLILMIALVNTMPS